MPRQKKERKPSLYLVASTTQEKRTAWIADELKWRSVGALRTLLTFAREDGGAYKGYTSNDIEAAIRYRLANDETSGIGDFYRGE